MQTSLFFSRNIYVTVSVLLCTFCIAPNVHAQQFEKSNGGFVRSGCKMTFSKSAADTIYTQNPVTGEQIMRVSKSDPQPTSVNGSPVMEEADTKPEYAGSEKTLDLYLLKNLKSNLVKLDDGDYLFDLSNVLVNEQGQVVFFVYSSIIKPGQWQFQIPDDIKNDLSGQIPVLLYRAKFTPAVAKGKKVPSFVQFPDGNYKFKVTNHKLFAYINGTAKEL